MSNPSGQIMMQQVVEDTSLPLALRLQCIRESSFRPTLSFLLRLIRDPTTPPRLRATAVIRYNQQLAIKEITRAQRSERTDEVEEPTRDTAAELV